MQFGRLLTDVPTEMGVSGIEELRDEIQHYWDVLLGREVPPVDSPYLDLQEVATAYYARAKEIHGLILELERERKIMKASPLYKFRTGYLRDFIEVSSKAADLGSRRLTQEKLLFEQRYDAGEM